MTKRLNLRKRNSLLTPQGDSRFGHRLKALTESLSRLMGHSNYGKVSLPGPSGVIQTALRVARRVCLGTPFRLVSCGFLPRGQGGVPFQVQDVKWLGEPWARTWACACLASPSKSPRSRRVQTKTQDPPPPVTLLTRGARNLKLKRKWPANCSGWPRVRGSLGARDCRHGGCRSEGQSCRHAAAIVQAQRSPSCRFSMCEACSKSKLKGKDSLLSPPPPAGKQLRHWAKPSERDVWPESENLSKLYGSFPKSGTPPGGGFPLTFL